MCGILLNIQIIFRNDNYHPQADINNENGILGLGFLCNSEMQKRNGLAMQKM